MPRLWCSPRLLLVPLLLLVGLASGCVLVRPYERELLAQPGMSLSPGPDAEIEQHALEAREGSFGGYGSMGGGCGCN